MTHKDTRTNPKFLCVYSDFCASIYDTYPNLIYISTENKD